MDTPTKGDYKEVDPIDYHINCHTDGCKLDHNRTGAGVLIYNSHNDIAEEDIHLDNNASVFQAKVLQREEQHSTLYSLKSKQKCCNKLLHDSQAAITP